MTAPDGLGEYLRKHEFRRLLTAANTKFYRYAGQEGQFGPTVRVTVQAPTAAELEALSGLLGTAVPKKRWSRSGAISVRLQDLDEAFRTSRFHCGIRDVLDAHFGDATTRRAAERRAAEAWAVWLDLLRSHSPEHPRAQRWLHRLATDPRTAQRLPRFVQEGRQAEAFSIARAVLSALANLPVDHPAKATQRLPVVATQATGDPHAFDPGQLTTGYFLRALQDDFPESVQLGAGRESRDLLLATAGIVSDWVSSFVTVSGTLDAFLSDGSRDSTLNLTPGVPRLITLAELHRWERVVATPHVYIVENPSVFETFLASAPQSTLLCTRGFPSAASLWLLDRLAESGARMHYSGDFDPNGLVIARNLRRRYPTQLSFWCFDGSAYQHAAAHEGRAFTEPEKIRIATLQTDFPGLVEAMLTLRRAAYQEGIVDLLQQDLSGMVKT